MIDKLTSSKIYQNLFLGKRFYIVAYHNIIDDLNKKFIFDLNNVSCDKKKFEDQLIYYKQNYHVIKYSNLHKELASHIHNKPILIITFDDGYKSFHDIAAPLLIKHDLPATVFLSTDYIGSMEIFWWDELIFLCNKLTCEIFFRDGFSPFFNRDSKLEFALNNGDHSFKLALLNYLKKFCHRKQYTFIRYLKKKFKEIFDQSHTAFNQVRVMTWEQIKSLAAENIEFGSHTLSHCMLDKCSIEIIRHEIFRSKQILEEQLGHEITLFCYPSGCGSNQTVHQCLKEAGYIIACLVEFGINSVATFPLAHTRLPITLGTTVGDIARKLQHPLLHLSIARGKKLAKQLLATTRKTYIASEILVAELRLRKKTQPKHVFVAICDHYEPYWNYATHNQAYSRVKKWVDTLPSILEKYKDADGRSPVYCFFYPEEEYKPGLLNMLRLLQANGYGEVEIHLHHDGDTDTTLREKLNNFKLTLRNRHGLLPSEVNSENICYGFVHGNWALDNSRTDGRWCGVNNEITVLKETGCYADFTMPSAPAQCQTRIKNSIYYAIDDPQKPMSHDTGPLVRYNAKRQNGLLMVQGPLSITMNRGLFKIENSEITNSHYATSKRAEAWLNCGISLHEKPEWVFIKLHAHGAQEPTMQRLFDHGNLAALFSILTEKAEKDGFSLHFVSARQMANVIHALEDGNSAWNPKLLDYRYTLT